VALLRKVISLVNMVSLPPDAPAASDDVVIGIADFFEEATAVVTTNLSIDYQRT
jgi:hypothetical protein